MPMFRLLAAALLATLAACNTVDGIGQDLSVGGTVISDVANKSRHPHAAPQPCCY